MTAATAKVRSEPILRLPRWSRWMSPCACERGDMGQGRVATSDGLNEKGMRKFPNLRTLTIYRLPAPMSQGR
jgi:hypothetical protein